jgi:hypothetical protein
MLYLSIIFFIFTMKYCKEWRETYETLPIQLQDISLSYKNWKKRVKNNQFDTKALEEECHKLHSEFHKLYYQKHRFFSCCKGQHIKKNEIAVFLQMNKKTLYKLGKKISKHSRYTIDTNKLIGDWVIKIELDLGLREPGDCPICLDAIESCVIMKCGHLLCINCFETIFHVKGKKGTIYNILSNCCPVLPCPMCRTKMHYSQLGPESFWPDSALFFKIDHF